MEEYGFPINYQPRNNTLREFCLSKFVSHREIAAVIGKDKNDIEKWKMKIDRFCSITNPQKIKDKDWDVIVIAMSKLKGLERS